MLVFIVEDDQLYADILNNQLQLHPDITTKKIKTGGELLAMMHLQPDVISLDYSLPDYNGDKLMSKIFEINSDVDVIFISNIKEISKIVDLIRNGAYDFIEKNKSAKNRFRKDIVELYEKFSIKNEINKLKTGKLKHLDWSELNIGESRKALQLINEINTIASSELNFCISAEKGLRSEQVVQLIHNKSELKDKEFKVIDFKLFKDEEEYNDQLLSPKNGVLAAPGLEGTVLFKNFEISSDLFQLKLKRILKNNLSKKNNIRFALYSDKNIRLLTDNKAIDEGIYQEFCAFTLSIPPLRDRPVDILRICNQMIYKICEEQNLPLIQLSKKAQKKLKNYPFPGNIDELEKVVKASISRSNQYIIEANDIVFDQTTEEEENFLRKEMTLKEYTSKIVQFFLDEYNDDVLLVAKKLKVGKSTLYRMINNGSVELKTKKEKKKNE